MTIPKTLKAAKEVLYRLPVMDYARRQNLPLPGCAFLCGPWSIPSRNRSKRGLPPNWRRPVIQVWYAGHMEDDKIHIDAMYLD
jgi:hypothetical protein